MASGVMYGLELQAQAIAPLYQECGTGAHRFLVGTCSKAAKNKIHVLEFSDETKSFECVAIWSHKEQINSIRSSPSLGESGIFSTVSSNSMKILRTGTSLETSPSEVLSVQKRYQTVLWDLDGLQNQIKACSDFDVSTISLDGSKLGTETSLYHFADLIQTAALDPHHPSSCMIALAGKGLATLDFRSKKAQNVQNSVGLHGYGDITSIDFNPTTPDKFFTCGTDGLVLLHDLRYEGGTSLSKDCVLKAHDHYVNKAYYNPFHDDLILTGSSDESLKLWDLANHDEPKCLKRLLDFSDTVRDLCWSGNSPWVFAGVSFNGKVIVDTVPNEKKMSILL